MIRITSAEQASKITNDALLDIDFDSLLAIYKKEEFGKEPASLFVVLLCLLHKKKDSFSLDWIIENIGTPDYYAKDDKKNWDIYYVLSGDESVGWVQIQNDLFDSFGTIEWSHFEERALPNIKKWENAQQSES